MNTTIATPNTSTAPVLTPRGCRKIVRASLWREELRLLGQLREIEAARKFIRRLAKSRSRMANLLLRFGRIVNDFTLLYDYLDDSAGCEELIQNLWPIECDIHRHLRSVRGSRERLNEREGRA